MIIKFEIQYNTDTKEFLITNEETGECKSVKKSSKTIKKGESSKPQLILEDNKYCLNTAAVELLNVTSDDKLDIKYEKCGNLMQPIIGKDEAFGTKGGNKVTKSNTVACRGAKNQELHKYGNTFDIVPHESKEGLFKLIGDTIVSEPSGDENINTEKVDEDLPLDIDLSVLVDDKDADIEQIDSSYFQL